MGPKSVSHLYSYAYNHKRHTVRYDHLLSYGIHFYYVVVELFRIMTHKHNCSTYHQNTIQIHVYVVTLQPIHGNAFSLISLLKSLTYTASDTSALISLLSTAFHIMAPLYLMPVFPKSDATAGI